MDNIIRVNEKDNVVTSTVAYKKGDKIRVNGKEITLNDDIPRFHKIAIENINKNDLVYKYGEVIGDATEEIKIGDHVHVENLESTRGRGDKGGNK